MKAMHSKSTLVVIIILIFASLSNASARQNKLTLTDKDRRAITQIALIEGIKDFRSRFKKPSILDNCQTLFLRNEEVLFLSTNNIEPKFVPKISNFHFEIMTPDEIETELETNRRHCYFSFERFENTGTKVEITLSKTLNLWSCPTCVLYIYAERIVYEFRKVKGKWIVRYLRGFTLES
jgi:hypothetical protein